MVRRLWQTAMIGLARSPRVTSFMQRTRSTSTLARRFVAGKTPSEAIDRALHLLQKDGIRSSLFYMGEYVDRPDLVRENVEAITEAVRALGRSGLDIHVSIDPTQIGHQIKPELAQENARRIAAVLQDQIGDRTGVHCLMLDMEDTSVTAPTIALHNALQDDGYPVALTLQAYLRRTMADLTAQIARGSRVRLVKGAFAAGPDVAFTSRAEIKRNSRALIDLMLSSAARDSGFYPIIATHDTRLHDYAIERARRSGWAAGEYEFEMLLGVRGDVAQALARRGERVRLYVPFGRDWWPYAVRRIGENPANAVLLARSLLGTRRLPPA